MSASLVGSEMCIRDRGSLAWTSSTTATTLSSHVNAIWHIWRCEWRWKAVSYTHLTLPTICSV
eukprot:4110400-Alexandrium_andersonii.AAC.1